MKVVFDFGGVLFNWHPPSLLRRELPHRAADEASASHWVREFFQGYGGDWAEFDRGTVETPELVSRIARRTGLPGAELAARLLELELEGRVSRMPGGLFQRCGRA